VSWFVVAAPFVITALGTAMSMQLNLDEVILIQNMPSRETFTNEQGASFSIDTLPQNVSDPSLQAKTESTYKRFRNSS
jgi:hypothetical protein